MKCDSPELARALHNAMIFLPAKNKVPFCAITITSSDVLTIGSHDDIVIGTDSAPVIDATNVVEPVTALITKDDIERMERAAREAKKGITCDLEVLPLSVSLTPMGGSPVTAVNHAADTANAPWLDNFAAIREMLSTVQKRCEVIRGTLALSRGYFSKFDKVKTSSKDHPLHLAMADQYYPVMVKCGPTFKGMVAPVHEDVYEKNCGQEGLW